MGSWAGEVVQRSRDGARRAIWARVAAVRDESGQAVGAIAINRDISELKGFQGELQAVGGRLNERVKELKSSKN